MNFFAGIFQSFWHQGKKGYFAAYLSVITSILLQVDFLLFFKDIIRDGFYQRGEDLSGVKHLAMLALIATVFALNALKQIQKVLA